MSHAANQGTFGQTGLELNAVALGQTANWDTMPLTRMRTSINDSRNGMMALRAGCKSRKSLFLGQRRFHSGPLSAKSVSLSFLFCVQMLC